MSSTFSLQIDTGDIAKRYNLPSSTTLTNIDTAVVKKKKSKQTNIDNLLPTSLQSTSQNQPYIASYVDNEKRQKKCAICLYNVTDNGVLPNKTEMKCFNCHHQFDTKPLGCPIKYIKDGDYICDGIFCSFNCVLQFIEDNTINKNTIYKDSKQLLYHLYYQIYPTDNTTTTTTNEFIIPAGSFRLLKSYGGPFTIEEYRQNFNTIIYDQLHPYNNRFKFIPSCMVYDMKTKFQ